MSLGISDRIFAVCGRMAELCGVRYGDLDFPVLAKPYLDPS